MLYLCHGRAYLGYVRLCPGFRSDGANIGVESVTERMLPIVHQVCGIVLIAVGLVVLPLPLPFGLIMITLGCALLAPYVPYVQRLIKKMRRKWPAMNAQLLKYRDRLPPVIRKTIDKTHPDDAAAE